MTVSWTVDIDVRNGSAHQAPTRRWAELAALALQELRIRQLRWGIAKQLRSAENSPVPMRQEACNRAEAECLKATDGSNWADELARDAADVRASLGGDHSSYARLVRRYQPEIAAYMWRFTRDPQAWDELVQDVFVEAYCSLASYSGRAPWLHWLKRIATRVGYRHWKELRRRRTECSLAETCHEGIVRAIHAESSSDAAELVHRLLNELKPRDRLVMTLTYLEDLSVKEIAGLTGWTEVMVKVQVHRARRRLARICHRLGIEL